MARHTDINYEFKQGKKQEYESFRLFKKKIAPEKKPKLQNKVCLPQLLQSCFYQDETSWQVCENYSLSVSY